MDAADSTPAMGQRRFGRVNWLGLATITWREIARFSSVWTQTVLAPIATGGLFMAVFALALAERRGDVAGVPFLAFLAPGILMMQVIQNAFANTSSSILIAKIQGNIVDTLMPPLSATELMIGYTMGGVARGLLVAVAMFAVLFPLVGLGVARPLWAVAFLVLGSGAMALLGIIAGILAQKFDQMATLTNFVVTPLSFLSGTFYSIRDLPWALEAISRFNPVFYMIDGARFGVLGQSDAPPLLSLAVTAGLVGGLWWYAHRLFRTGYRLKA